MGTHHAGTATEISALDTYIKLSRAADAVTHHINAHLHDHGLTVSQFGVLEALYHLGPMQTGEVGQKILKSSGNMTLVIDNLMKRGYVTRRRREDDRRCIDIHLTESGRALIAAIWPQHVAGVVDTFAALSPEEQGQLAALCRKLGLAVLAQE
jgi:MarR family 2-MHQ and catechol resistance regulon transcriptional repressor